MCDESSLGMFIASVPEGKTIEDTSIYTVGVQFDPNAQPGQIGGDADNKESSEPEQPLSDGQVPNDTTEPSQDPPLDVNFEEWQAAETGRRRRPQRRWKLEDWQTTPDNEDDSNKESSNLSSSDDSPTGNEGEPIMDSPIDESDDSQDELPIRPSRPTDETEPAARPMPPSTPTQTFDSPPVSKIPIYTSSIEYRVPKTGYYCVGVVPVTTVNGRRSSGKLQIRQDPTHASYSGSVLFRNEFEGELPAADYPKIGVSQSVRH